LASLDLAAEFAALGVELIGSEPKADGWLPCRAVGRDDRSPSAAVNLRTGRYRDLGGSGLSLSLWDFAAQFGPFPTWQDARRHFGDKAGVKLPRGRPPIDPTAHLQFLPWNHALAARWTLEKEGVIVKAIQAAGGRLARYRGEFTVVALPIIGPLGPEQDPVGWVLWQTNGHPLPVWEKGRSELIRWVKNKATAGSETGLMGLGGLRQLYSAQLAGGLVWKTEGPLDAMALWAAIPPELRDTQLAVCNASGATENPQQWMIDLFAGRNVVVIPDADRPGEAGGRKWAENIATVAAGCKLARLPYEISDDHGRDLRDWLGEGHTYAELLAITKAANLVEPQAVELPLVDPSELDAAVEARVFLGTFEQDGLSRLRFWRGSFHLWQDGGYHELSPAEIRAQVIQALNRSYRKLPARLITDVIDQLRAQSILEYKLDPPCWLSAPLHGWRAEDVLSTANGLLHLPSLIEERECFLPPTPAFFTPVRLPFAFDTDAPRPDVWLGFLRQLWGDDDESIAALQQWFGYCLTPDTRQQKILMIVGPKRSGKGTIARILCQLVGSANTAGPTLQAALPTHAAF